MKIVDRKTFLAMPAGTVYAKIPVRWIVNNLCVKFETTDYNDWYYMSFDWVDASDSGEAIDRLEEMWKSGTSYPVQNSVARDGLFDEDDHFLVYEQEEVEHIIHSIKENE